MRTWLLTSTTYGSWLPGSGRGSVTSVRDLRPGDVRTEVRFEHDLPGEPYEEAMPGLEANARALMKGPPIILDTAKAWRLRDQFQETATYRGWHLLAGAIMYNHFHLILQVSGDPDPHRMLSDIKAYGSRVLNEHYGRPRSKTWWTMNGSTRKLRDIPAAVDYVMKKQPDPLVVWNGEPEALATGGVRTGVMRG